MPEPGRFEEEWGVEDPRITEIDGDYYIVYTGYSRAVRSCAWRSPATSSRSSATAC